MPIPSQLWSATKKAAVVIGVLAIAHAVAAPRECGGCGVKSSKSQAAANPAENSALGGPDTKTRKTTLKRSATGMRAKGFNPQPDPPGKFMATDPLMDTPRLGTPGTTGGGAGGGARTR